jgi:hypothetical protein
MIYCETCHNEGIYLEEDTARFCSCPAGQEAKKNWENYNERMKAEAMKYRKKKKRILEDYKSKAAGNINGDDFDVPF